MSDLDPEILSTQEGQRELVLLVLSAIGEDVKRNGILETPSRVIKSWKELYSGYNIAPEDVLKEFDNDSDYDGIVLLRDIEFYSMCEHHMLPFIGRAHIAYLPAEKIVGISKLARLLEVFARRLQVQERLGQQVVDCLMKHLDAGGAACIIEADHYCIRMRGANKQHSTMVTSSLAGAFKDNLDTRNELMALIKGQA